MFGLLCFSSPSVWVNVLNFIIFFTDVILTIELRALFVNESL